MKYAVEMGLVTVIYVPSFIKFGSGNRKSIGGMRRSTDTQPDDRINLRLFLQNKESSLMKHREREKHNMIPLFIKSR
jgi:hypothetical protein